MRLDTNAIIKTSWSEYKRHFNKFIPIGLIIVVIDILHLVIAYIDETLAIHSSQEILIALASLLLAFVSFIVYLGMIHVSLDVVREKEPLFERLFDNKQVIFPFILLSFLTVLAVFLGTLMFIIPGIIIAIGITFAPYLLIDQQVTPLNALKESWNITKGFKWSIFWLTILCGLIMLLGSITIIGTFITTPLIGIIYAHAFLSIKDYAQQHEHNVVPQGDEEGKTNE